MSRSPIADANRPTRRSIDPSAEPLRLRCGLGSVGSVGLAHATIAPAGPASWCTRRYMSILFICVYLRTGARTERRVDGRKALVLLGYGISTFAYLLAWQVRTHARTQRAQCTVRPIKYGMCVPV